MSYGTKFIKNRLILKKEAIFRTIKLNSTYNNIDTKTSGSNLGCIIKRGRISKILGGHVPKLLSVADFMLAYCIAGPYLSNMDAHLLHCYDTKRDAGKKAHSS